MSRSVSQILHVSWDYCVTNCITNFACVPGLLCHELYHKFCMCPGTTVSRIVSQILHVCLAISLHHLADFFSVSCVSHGCDNDGNDDDDDDDNGGEWPKAT